MRAWSWWLVAAVAIAGGGGARAQTPGEGPSEYEVKAAFLYNFAKFTEWPPQSFPGGNAPIVFCVLGEDPFGNALDEVVRGKMINNRPIVILRTKKVMELRSCQVVFISTAESSRLAEILAALKGTTALVVGESPGFGERGGQIQFLMEDNKVRFSMNTDALERSHLKVSSKLLALARIIHDSNR